MNRTLGLLYQQEGESSKAARCYSTMQRVLENLGETEAAGYYGNLAGSDQTTTWEAKGSEFDASDFDVGNTRAQAAGRRKSISPASGSPSGRTPRPRRLQCLPCRRLPSLGSHIRQMSRSCWRRCVFASHSRSGLRPRPRSPALPQPSRRTLSCRRFVCQLLQSHPSSAVSNVPPPAASYASFEVIEVGSSPVAPPPVQSPPPLPAAPIAVPTLSSLAAELDAELGDSFTPAPQPRREAPAPVSRPVQPAPRPPVIPGARRASGCVPGGGTRHS